MSAPRLEIRLDLIHHNASTLVERLAGRGIAVTAVGKATLGDPEIARELLRAGVARLGDSRVENLERLRHAGVDAPTLLIRSPMMSQADRVVARADVSCNTELAVIDRLSMAARGQRRRHGVILMVELGDLREGILPADLAAAVTATMNFPGIVLRGIGTNLACQSGVEPDQAKMDELSELAGRIGHEHGITMEIVSGGNSANLAWALDEDSDVGRVNDLRLGESVLLGREPLHRRPIEGLRTDAFTLVGEIIEVKTKPTVPWGRLGETAFGVQSAAVDRGDRTRVIVALGRQDVDPAGLVPPPGYEILGASSDHLVLDADADAGADAEAHVHADVDAAVAPEPGGELRFGVDYSALVRAMTSPFVTTTMLRAALVDQRT